MDRKIRRRHAFAALRALAAVVPGMVFAAGAEAAVVISSDATQDMTCSAGVCAPTAKKAVLNVGDLETMLGSGSVTITTTGSDVQASDVQVKSALGWIGDNALSLVAKRSVEIDQAMTVEDQGGAGNRDRREGTVFVRQERQRHFLRSGEPTYDQRRNVCPCRQHQDACIRHCVEPRRKFRSRQ
jgi:hypothetical protein